MRYAAPAGTQPVESRLLVTAAGSCAVLMMAVSTWKEGWMSGRGVVKEAGGA